MLQSPLYRITKVNTPSESRRLTPGDLSSSRRETAVAGLSKRRHVEINRLETMSNYLHVQVRAALEFLLRSATTVLPSA